jgi:hypothetical protein
MKLLHLDVSRITYGPDKGKFKGTAKFDGERGTIELNLNEHHCEQMFLTCADGIVEVAKAAARMFVQEAMANTEVAKQRQLVADVVEKAQP